MILLALFEKILFIDDLLSVRAVRWQEVHFDVDLLLLVIVVKILVLLNLNLGGIGECAEFCEVAHQPNALVGLSRELLFVTVQIPVLTGLDDELELEKFVLDGDELDNDLPGINDLDIFQRVHERDVLVEVVVQKFKRILSKLFFLV